jgi:hypothetical protein
MMDFAVVEKSVLQWDEQKAVNLGKKKAENWGVLLES